jgi:putative ABC transport system permease protein
VKAQRTRELGIRKVLGAGVGHLVAAFRDFLKIVVAAHVIATPVVCTGMNRGCQGFAYRLTWLVDAGAGGCHSGLVALVTGKHTGPESGNC